MAKNYSIFTSETKMDLTDSDVGDIKKLPRSHKMPLDQPSKLLNRSTSLLKKDVAAHDNEPKSSSSEINRMENCNEEECDSKQVEDNHRYVVDEKNTIIVSVIRNEAKYKMDTPTHLQKSEIVSSTEKSSGVESNVSGTRNGNLIQLGESSNQVNEICNSNMSLIGCEINRNEASMSSGISGDVNKIETAPQPHVNETLKTIYVCRSGIEVIGETSKRRYVNDSREIHIDGNANKVHAEVPTIIVHGNGNIIRVRESGMLKLNAAINRQRAKVLHINSNMENSGILHVNGHRNIIRAYVTEIHINGFRNSIRFGKGKLRAKHRESGDGIRITGNWNKNDLYFDRLKTDMRGTDVDGKYTFFKYKKHH